MSSAAREAEDRALIADLMGRYFFAMDWLDADSYADCFTEDGVLDYAGGVIEGREGIREGAKQFHAAIGDIFKREDGSPAMLRHVLDQMVIELDGDTATTRAFWWEMTDGGPGGAPALQSYGTFVDEVVRAGGQWLFRRRTIYNEFIPGRETPAHVGAAARE